MFFSYHVRHRLNHLPAHLVLPVEGYGEKRWQRDDKLQVRPVSDEPGEDSQQAHAQRPEVLDRHARERALLGREELTRQHEASQDDALPPNRNVSRLDVSWA